MRGVCQQVQLSIVDRDRLFESRRYALDYVLELFKHLKVVVLPWPEVAEYALWPCSRAGPPVVQVAVWPLTVWSWPALAARPHRTSTGEGGDGKERRLCIKCNI